MAAEEGYTIIKTRRFGGFRSVYAIAEKPAIRGRRAGDVRLYDVACKFQARRV